MGHYRTGTRITPQAASEPPAVVLSFDSGTGLASWTWSGTDPGTWYALTCGETDISGAGNIIGAGADRSNDTLAGSGMQWIVGSDDGSTPSTPFSNCVDTGL